MFIEPDWFILTKLIFRKMCSLNLKINGFYADEICGRGTIIKYISIQKRLIRDMNKN